MPEKDIFGNPIQQGMTTYKKPMSYAQKLREAKAKQKYKQYQAEQRRQQIENLKASAQKSRQGLKKTSGLIKSSYKRITDKRLSSFKDKLRGSIYKKE
jgi:hypothetical protein